MGEPFYINSDGSVTQHSSKKTVNDIDWLDFSQINGKSFTNNDIFGGIICAIPLYGWLIALICILVLKFQFGTWYWPFCSIQAIEDNDDEVKIYCNKKGALGLISKNRRLTPALFSSIEKLPIEKHPVYILELNKKLYVYNHINKRIILNGLDSIIYDGNTSMTYVKDGKKIRYSLIKTR